MRYWFTTHYPHYPDDNAEWFIYVPRGFQTQIAPFDKGDGIAFYEMKEGPNRVGKSTRPTGDRTVICLAVGSGPPRETSFSERLVDGREFDFVLECPCQEHDFRRDAISHDAVCDALGFQPSYTFRGYSDGAGFDEITPEQFARIERAFREAS